MRHVVGRATVGFPRWCPYADRGLVAYCSSDARIVARFANRSMTSGEINLVIKGQEFHKSLARELPNGRTRKIRKHRLFRSVRTFGVGMIDSGGIGRSHVVLRLDIAPDPRSPGARPVGGLRPTRLRAPVFQGRSGGPFPTTLPDRAAKGDHYFWPRHGARAYAHRSGFLLRPRESRGRPFSFRLVANACSREKSCRRHSRHMLHAGISTCPSSSVRMGWQHLGGRFVNIHE